MPPVAVPSRTTVRAALVRLVVGVLALIVGIAAFGLASDLLSRDKYRQAAITEVERDAVARQMLIDLLNAQAGQREFVLTEDPVLLDQYQRGVADYLSNLARVQAAATDDEQLTASVTRLATRADRWLTEVNRQVGLGLGGQSDQLFDRVLNGPGEQYFDDFRAEHAGLIALLSQRRLAAVDSARDWALAALLAGVGAALLAAAIVGVAGLRVVSRVTGPSLPSKRPPAASARATTARPCRSTAAPTSCAILPRPSTPCSSTWPRPGASWRDAPATWSRPTA